MAHGGQQIGITHSFCLSAALAADPRVTQMVNGSKGIHAVLDKKHFAR
jgi:hypothetical protein